MVTACFAARAYEVTSSIRTNDGRVEVGEKYEVQRQIPSKKGRDALLPENKKFEPVGKAPQ